MLYQLRIARPVTNLTRTATMYCQGLGLKIIDGFEDHDGFDGVMLGADGLNYHFEFTHCRKHPVVPMPTNEDLLVFYIETFLEWQSACRNFEKAGFVEVRSFNPYWDIRGRTYEDPDHYRIVLQNDEWQKA
jgi:hypothetical protein